jgi:hypothetical protein
VGAADVVLKPMYDNLLHNGAELTGGGRCQLPGARGNAGTRLEAFVASTGTYACGCYPDLGDLIRRQAQERDREKREAMLRRVQRLMHERLKKP